MNRFLSRLKSIGYKILPSFSVIMPKKHNLWVFGAWQGEQYSDNSKYMYEYILENHPEITAVWITRNKDVYYDLKRNNKKCVLRDSFLGVLYSVIAEVAFETEGNQDISPFLNTDKTKTIQLWHGVAPKKANWDSFQKSVVTKRQSYWMVSSQKNKQTMKSLIGMDDSHIFITGYPRNDEFFMSSPKSDLMEKLDNKYPGFKKIIYMPTHRNFGSNGPKVKMEDLAYADNYLRSNNILMVFKPHFHELKYYKNIDQQFTNVIIASGDEFRDVYSYIKEFDLLISDYSSIIYDYTCSGKPIVLFPYDLESFDRTDAGLFDYYKEIPAGPFCFDWTTVLQESNKLLREDSWRERREVCRTTFHPFSDGKNRERVYDSVLAILKR